MENLKKLFFIGYIFLVGCGHDYQVSIEPQYQTYVDRFLSDAHSMNRNIKIYDLIIKTTESLRGEIVGQCQKGFNTTPVIVISKKYWIDLSEFEREELLYHEMGHCVLMRRHRDDTDEMGIPKSLMYPYMLPEYVYRYYRNEYVSELFLNH